MYYRYLLSVVFIIECSNSLPRVVACVAGSLNSENKPLYGNCPQIQSKTKKKVKFLPGIRLAQLIFKHKFPSVHKPLKNGL